MPGLEALVLLLALNDFSGARALEDTRRVVALGPRWPASEAMRKQQDWIRAEMKTAGCELTEDAFSARTPRGAVPMRNLLCRFPGTNGRALVVSGHYDTKRIEGVDFAGANDGAASAAFLVELARALRGRPHASDIILVWLDGEEAFGEWSDADSVYGSRHLAARWESEGMLRQIRALVNVDMIGDRDLVFERETYSSASLWAVMRQVARDLGLERHFAGGREWPIEDDHLPFLKRGVAALDLIDFDYGPDNAWWHAAGDTPDKLSPVSLEVTGRLVLEFLKRLDK
jgi:glutaminyl-peptide cyclotransferase